MIKDTALLLAGLLLALPTLAQERCLSHTITERWMQEHGTQVDLAHAASVLGQPPAQRDANITIPVVVHVVWNIQAGNVPNSVINGIIGQINADYQALNSDYNNVRPAFTGSRGNPQIQFCLATVDPAGQWTTGIIRKQTSKTWFNPDTETDLMKFEPNGSPAWNPAKYLNIWICDISSGASGGFVTTGYAYLPQGGMVGTGYDGLVLDYAHGLNDRSATHEIGHYLGVPHPWGNGNGSCNPGDGISDTPPTDSPTFSCGNPNLMKCGALTQYENFMDYSNCPVMFTQGQVNVMDNILNGVRATLLTSNGCSGASGPCIPASANGTSGGDFIDGVVLGDVSNTNTGSTGGPAYVDYTALSTSVDRNGSYTISITGGAFATDHYAAWIDYNGDHTFSNTEKLGEFTATASNQTQSISFTVPPTAALGNALLRIRGVRHLGGEPVPTDPCFDYAYGETEDYTVTITSPGSVVLCIPSSAVGPADGDFIDGVELGTIHNLGSGSTTGPAYQDYTSNFSTTLDPDSSYTLKVTTGEYYENIVGAWIDFNGDNDFAPEEKIGEALSDDDFQVISFPFTVPSGAFPGNTVMRVRAVYPGDGQPDMADPCYDFDWGETEDYRIVINNVVAIPEIRYGNLALITFDQEVLVTWPQAAGRQQIMLLDAAGRLLNTDEVSGTQAVIPTAHLAAGMYVLVLSQNGVRHTARFVLATDR